MQLATLGKFCAYFNKKKRCVKKSVYFFYTPCSWWRKGPTVKASYYLNRPSKRSLKNFCLIAVQQSYGRLFTWRQNGCLRSMFLHGFRLFYTILLLTLFVVMERSRGNNLPSNPFLSSWRTRWCEFRVCAVLHSIRKLATSVLVSVCNLLSLWLSL